MKNIFKTLKKDLFYIRRLLAEGYGPRYWWPYIKNRFLGNYLFRYLSRYDYQVDPDLEVHAICCKGDIWMLAWMMRSLLATSNLKPVLIVHEDGTIDKSTEQLILSKFPNTKIMFRWETKKLISEMSDLPEVIRKASKDCHLFFERLLNIFIFSKAKKIIVSDSDILYYKTPIELINFVHDRSSYDALVSASQYVLSGPKDGKGTFDLMMDSYYTQKYNLSDNVIQYLNGGYIIIDREKLNTDQLIEFLTHTVRPVSNYFIEMSCFACILAQLNYKFLPVDTYHFKDPVSDITILKHFTSPRRYEMFAYGIDKARKVVDKIEKQEKVNKE